MKWLRKAVPSRERGAALIIVLAFVVLLTGVAIAYFSRTTSDRQVAHSSFNQSTVDQLAQSAMDNVIGDLRQEIVNGSTATTLSNGTTIYTPTAAANMVPQRSGNPGTVPNLIRRSVSPDTITPPGLPSRASAVNSATVSANGRSITSTRWNSHYLVPKKNTGPGQDDSLPIDDFTNATPDWVFVTSNGAGVIIAPNSSVLGRYSYAIYDEGGLLDINLAGYPTGTTLSQSSGKLSLAFADLTALPYPIPNPSGTTYQVDRIVGWRNYATTQPSNNFPDSLPAGQAFARNFQTSTTPATSFYNFVVNNPWGPLTVRSDVTYNGRTDQMFLGRQELIAFRSTTQFSANALQYLGTFSREAVAGAPQWRPPSPTPTPSPTSTNPNFQTLLVTNSFTRNDGSTANVGDPLVTKPFLLQRLNWLTYKGPSAPRYNSNDDDIKLLENTYGVAPSFLQQGTAANILKYLGLAWDTVSERWNYVGHGGGTLPIGSMADLETLVATREPDFFELLRAGILEGSVGDSFSPDTTRLPIAHQQSKILHILTIGANLIAQSRADSYPVRIACSVGGTIMEAVGAPRLPYLNSLAACPVGTTNLLGGMNWFLVPNLWDPFRNTWDLTSTANPAYPRPSVRITVNGGVGFGDAPAASQTGSVTSGVTPFATTPLSASNASLTLKTGTTTLNAFGRDGLREALRLGTSDITTTVTPFDPAQPILAFAGWNSIGRPANDLSPYRTDNLVVFKLSLPGINIPLPSINRTPVLILKPGFQITMDYQSPNGTWYSYSFLQGNNETSTWISGSNIANPSLNLAAARSRYGVAVIPLPTPSAPTIVNPTPIPLTATPWDITTVREAPMFAKGDPRSIRYNSQIGVVNLSTPPMSFASAGVIGSIWPDTRATPPNPYIAPPLMFTPDSPGPTPSPNPNPAVYSQVGDNGPAASDPFDEFVPTGQTTSIGDNVRPIVMNRPFRSVGEMGYAFRDQPFRTLSFSSGSPGTPSPDAGLLDLFSANDYPTPSPTATPSFTPTPTPRAGVINLNSHQRGAIAAVLAGAVRKESPPTPVLLGATDANSVATTLASLGAPVVNKAGLAALIANVNPIGFDATVPKTEREAIARALGEGGQTRTWNLLIDVIAQRGKYAPGETNLTKFIVAGEQRYWIHVAIDRFTGQVIDKQIEVVNE
jgi:Tfp pilus assembly protein PilX